MEQSGSPTKGREGSQQAGDRRGLCTLTAPSGGIRGWLSVSVSLLSLSVSHCLCLSCYRTYHLEATGIGPGISPVVRGREQRVISSGSTAEPSAQRAGKGKRTLLVSGCLPPLSLCVGGGLCFQRWPEGTACTKPRGVWAGPGKVLFHVSAQPIPLPVSPQQDPGIDSLL